MTEHGKQADPPAIDEIITRLEFELGRSGAGNGRGAAAPSLAARVEAEKLAGVTADRPYLYKPGLVGRIRGLVLVPAKFVLRKLMRWYVEPVTVDQRAFNYSVLRLGDALSDALSERIDEVVRRVSSLEGELAALTAAQAQSDAETRARGAQLGTAVEELDDRLVRLERRPAGQPAQATGAAARKPATVPPADEIPFDYFAFESRMRGPRSLIVERQRRYLDDFRDTAPVLDVGCGRGEFLALLREAGIEARGIDLDEDMVAFCRGEGLEVEQGDALTYLESLEEASLGGIFAAQVVEHLRPGPLTALLNLAASRVRPGGALVLETINPLSLFALRNYFADLTHAQPLVPDTLSLLAKQAGFDGVEIRFLNEPEEGQRLEPVELPPDPSFDPARRALESNRARLNEVVFGPQDYALVARR
ncbi:MAG TPA: class I SAM-dependent methyltransferase [Gaiellaceae bacterium]